MRASASSGRVRPSCASARSSSLSSAASSSRLRTKTWQRDRSAPGGADQHDGAVLDIGQEGVLLRPVEAVDLVDEEQRSLAAEAPLLRRIEDLAQLGDAGEDGGDRLEMEVGRLGEKTRDRRLAASGWTPQDHRGEAARRDHPADRPVRPEEMILADHLGEGPWAQTIGERPRCLRFKEAGHAGMATKERNFREAGGREHESCHQANMKYLATPLTLPSPCDGPLPLPQRGEGHVRLRKRACYAAKFFAANSQLASLSSQAST